MRIVNNYEYNSIELYFDGKPDEMTRETLKMFKWRWNPKKFYRYNKNTAENKALAESLNKSTDEMKDKKIPESYSEKYEKKEKSFCPCSFPLPPVLQNGSASGDPDRWSAHPAAEYPDRA